MVPDTLEAALFTQVALHLGRRISEARLFEQGNQRAVFGEMSIEFHQHRFYRRLRQHVAAACKHFVLEAVDVDFDVVRHRDDTGCDQLIERRGEAALNDVRWARLEFEV
jgi:hypothetical protein